MASTVIIVRGGKWQPVGDVWMRLRKHPPRASSETNFTIGPLRNSHGTDERRCTGIATCISGKHIGGSVLACTTVCVRMESPKAVSELSRASHASSVVASPKTPCKDA